MTGMSGSAWLKACVHDFPGFRIGDANEPRLATTWWLTVSVFVHVTESSWLIVTLALSFNLRLIAL